MSGTINFTLGGTLKIVQDEALGYCLVELNYRDFTITARGQDMAYTLASGTQVHLKVSYVDSAGNPARVDGEITWDSSDPSIADVVVDAGDSSKSTVRAVGPTGQVQVAATADADLGGGVREIVTPMDVDVVAGEAVAGVISPVGSAEPIPASRTQTSAR